MLTTPDKHQRDLVVGMNGIVSLTLLTASQSRVKVATRSPY
ncbi:hypothetical protein [Tranquillimonas rosea]